jgi:hypothetical protein
VKIICLYGHFHEVKDKKSCACTFARKWRFGRGLGVARDLLLYGKLKGNGGSGQRPFALCITIALFKPCDISTTSLHDDCSLRCGNARRTVSGGGLINANTLET